MFGKNIYFGYWAKKPGIWRLVEDRVDEEDEAREELARLWPGGLWAALQPRPGFPSFPSWLQGKGKQISINHVRYKTVNYVW